VTLQDAVREALRTGQQIRRAEWVWFWRQRLEMVPAYARANQVGLSVSRVLDQRHGQAILAAEDVLAEDWEMVPREETDVRPNAWVPK
jgi:hypothetical protein